MEQEIKKGNVFITLLSRENQDVVRQLKEEVQGSSPLRPYVGDFKLEVHSGENASVAYIYYNNKKIGMIRQTNSTEPLKEKYGDFLEIKDLEAIANNCEISIIDTTPGGKALIGRVVECEHRKSIELMVSENGSKQYEQKLINDGILDEAELDERIAYMELHGINAKDTPILFIGVLGKIHKQDTNITRPKKLYVPNTSGESLIKRMLRNIVLGDPVILEGPKSVGKNVAWESVQWLLNRPMEVLNCSARMTRADMFGSPSTDNSAKDRISLDGAKSFIKTLFTKKEDEAAAQFLKNIAECMSPSIRLEAGPVTRAILSAKECGTILVADELNLSDPNTFSGAFNALTDKHTKEYNIAGIGVVELSDDMIIGGTQNGTGGAYVGTKAQNQATMSRFNVISIDSPGSILSILRENNHEGKINRMIGVSEEYKIDKRISLERKSKRDIQLDFSAYEKVCADSNAIEKKLDKIYQEFSDAVESGTVTEEALNVRGFERAMAHILLGQSIKEAVCECVINTCTEDVRLTLETFVDNVVA